MSSEFELVESETKYEGKIFSVKVGRFRHEDGEVVTREIAEHTGAVAVVALDGDELILVAQPREAIDDPALLELPAGRLDVDGEPPLETAKRELAEEIGKAAATWEPLGSYWNSPGFTNERIHIFLATGLSDTEVPDHGENERIDVVRRPLAELDALIDETKDGKTVTGLLYLRRKLNPWSGARRSP